MNKAVIGSYPTIQAKELRYLFEGTASPSVLVTPVNKSIKPFTILTSYNKDTGRLKFYSEDKQHQTKFYIIQKPSNLGKGVRYYFSLDKEGKYKTDKLYLIELSYPHLNKKILGFHSHFQFKHYYAIQKQSHNNRRFDVMHKYNKKAEDIFDRKYVKRKYAGKETRTFKKALRYQDKASDSEFKLMLHFQRRFGHLL